MGTTTITVTDGGENGTGAQVTSGNYEVVNAITVSQDNLGIDENGKVQFTATGGSGQYTWTVISDNGITNAEINAATGFSRLRTATASENSRLWPRTTPMAASVAVRRNNGYGSHRYHTASEFR